MARRKVSGVWVKWDTDVHGYLLGIFLNNGKKKAPKVVIYVLMMIQFLKNLLCLEFMKDICDYYIKKWQNNGSSNSKITFSYKGLILNVLAFK